MPNKRRRPPSSNGFIAGTEIEIGLRLKDGGIEIHPERDRQADELYDRLRRDCEADRPTAFMFPREVKPPQQLMSRLLAKTALETAALRIQVNLTFWICLSKAS